ncbi:MAG: hypothetical protein K5880_07310 [Hydrogenophaga sp.]|uniref:hypothetical protein n=1 Tax=Hydrogenophaga sp. TaxID=1904254 RepID=UPI002617E8B3|nr:hypothetical protein [Hydrogenophaga sp.]MCV0438423.1 hypothetical protein [Hydrogenophaga sp.]
MKFRSIEVAEYVADDFERPLSTLNQAGLDRVYFLVKKALADIEWPEWEVAGRRFHSKNGNEPFGFEDVNGKLYIYSEERGIRSAIAIFKDDHLAAKYFVWLISKGERSINWDLFPDKLP